MESLIEIKLAEQSDKRRKYTIHHKGSIKFFGLLVVEKYDNWNIELMNVLVPCKGYGTLLLNYVLNDLFTINSSILKVTTCPISYESENFFEKNGFDRQTWTIDKFT